MRERWPRILDRTERLRQDYDRQNEAIDLVRDYFYVRLPETPLSESAEWSVMLQSVSGWLLDFEGWSDAGGQGVF